MSEIITVRVEKNLKDKIRQHKINISETVRVALEDEIRRIENTELSAAISEMKLVLEKIPDAEILATIHDLSDPR
ncbi:MAG: type II toxin-antitoxin system CcdA family antitoxin [Nitrososphaerota archaeon]|jgi:ferredoxin-fold anticodon binding domain-containing protein|nr:type II toxin-antitoxin system CcdA family antitoxin [Nitrososphaerota archaeon]